MSGRDYTGEWSPKKVAERQDYELDVSALLDSGETFTPAVTVVGDPTLTIDGAPTQASNVIKFWLTDGTAGKTPTISFVLTTSAGRIEKIDVPIAIR